MREELDRGTLQKQKVWIIVFLAVTLLSLLCFPAFRVLYEDWNAASWALACSIVCGLQLAERYYRYLCITRNRVIHNHVRCLLLIGIGMISASITASIIYILLSAYNDRTFFPDGYAMSLFWTLFTLIWSIFLVYYANQYHVFRKYNLWMYYFTLGGSIFGVLSGIACVLTFTLKYKNPPAAAFGGFILLMAGLVAFEFIYRHYCLIRNKPTHNHLKLFFLFGLIGMLLGKAGETICIGLGLRDKQNWFPEGYYVSAIIAVVGEFWGFSLMWTVLHFRATEVSVDLFFKASINDSSPLLDSDDSDEDHS